MKTRALLFALPLAGTLALGSTAWAGEAASPVAPDAAQALRKAQELIQTGKYKEAATECERASELSTGPCPECLLGVARAYTGAGELEAAIQVTRMAIPLLASAPQDQARAYMQLGALLVRSGAEASQSDEALRRAVALDAGLQAEVRAKLAEALLARARKDASRQQTAVPAEVAVEAPVGAGAS
jgi:tetratricopeptide (TPR) repeat protein